MNSETLIKGVVTFVLFGVLGWAGATLFSLSTKVATLEATQVQLIKTIDRTLDELSK